MRITLESLGKKFNKDWIFRNVNTFFESNNSYTFVGANGSGKSTLLQVILGSMPATEGKIVYELGKIPIDPTHFFRYVSLATPYLELIEEFTLTELLTFHSKFKPFRNNLTIDEVIEKIGLANARHKTIQNFSSGMKQRVKLALAFFSDTQVIMLDEPTANLDKQGSDWYLQQIESQTVDRLLFICSNQPAEYEFCKNIINIQSLK
jgi:ABC-type multidrug transport system ATPase subunit